MMKKAKFHDRNREKIYTIVFLSLTTFLFFGMTPLLVSKNFQTVEIEDGPVKEIFKAGLYADFNSEWFQNIAPIITEVMLFNAFWPFIEFLIFWFWRYIWRALD